MILIYFFLGEVDFTEVGSFAGAETFTVAFIASRKALPAENLGTVLAGMIKAIPV